MGPRFPSLCGLRRFVSLPDRREGCEGAPSIPPSSRLPFTHLCVFGLGLDTQHVIEVFFHGHPGCPIVACGVKRTHQLCETSPCPGWSIPPSTRLGSRTPSNPVRGTTHPFPPIRPTIPKVRTKPENRPTIHLPDRGNPPAKPPFEPATTTRGADP
eukprot:scaffold1997_cov318-Pavlova_lutheri.AAC.5